MKIGLIGFGYWGKVLLQNLLNSGLFEHVYIYDIDSSKTLNLAPTENVSCLTDLNLILNDVSVEAVIISSLPTAHYELCKKSLESSKHVLVEKPLCLQSSHGSELLKLAEENQRVLMVDHTYIYSGAIHCIKHLIEANEIGAVQNINSERFNTSVSDTFQKEIDVVWDMTYHDLYIFNFLLEQNPISIRVESRSNVELIYREDIRCESKVSWSAHETL